MAALTALVAQVRGEEPPAERYDPRTAGVRQTGNPRKQPGKQPRKQAKAEDPERKQRGA